MTKFTRSEQIADSTARQVMLAIDPGDKNGSAVVREYSALNPDGSIFWRAYASRDAAQRVVDAHPGQTIGFRDLTVTIGVGEWTPEKPAHVFKTGDSVTFTTFGELVTGTIHALPADEDRWIEIDAPSPNTGKITRYFRSASELTLVSAARKFKVGDRVEIVRSEAYAGALDGRAGTIKSETWFGSRYDWEVQIDGEVRIVPFREDELTPALADWEKALLGRTDRPLEVGDRVEIRDAVTAEFTGLYGTILTVATDARKRTRYIVETGPGRTHGYAYTSDWVRRA